MAKTIVMIGSFDTNTRKRVARSLAMLRNKSIKNPRRKHGNIPL